MESLGPLTCPRKTPPARIGDLTSRAVACCRHNSAVPSPASPCYKIVMIYSSLCRATSICVSPLLDLKKLTFYVAHFSGASHTHPRKYRSNTIMARILSEQIRIQLLAKSLICACTIFCRDTTRCDQFSRRFNWELSFRTSKP